MNKKLLIIIGVVLVGVLYVAIVRQDSSTPGIDTEIPEVSSQFTFEENEFDFGLIKQSGGKVSHEFAFTYTGDDPIKITGVPTSCACTSATVDKTELNPGDSAVLTVKFNPNLHEEPEGKFFKTATLLTDPKAEERPEVRIWVEIDLDLGQEAYELKSDHDEEEEEEEDGLTSYNSITPEKLTEMLANKDFQLVDVHIPEQAHIEGTDALIPYNEIADNLDQLPADKDAKIVLYCRSGGMSRAAAYTLAEHGYTNVYDLVGGKNAYDKFMEEQNDKDLSASGKVGYIEFEAYVVTALNLGTLNDKTNGELDGVEIQGDKTYVLLEMNNHRTDLSSFDYQKLATLNGSSAEQWTSSPEKVMGGHHVTGILEYPKMSLPKSLAISGLPVGEVVLNFKAV